jgi:hypothetical protein
MEADAENEMEWGRRDRLLGSLDRMVGSGRLTETEAERLRAAAEPNEFNKAVRDIRIRHAAMKLDAAVADGSLARAEADRLLDRLRQGEHGRSLRAYLRTLRSRVR